MPFIDGSGELDGRADQEPSTARRILPDEIEPMDIGIVLAITQNGFSKGHIISVLGYMPDLNITPEELALAAYDLIRLPKLLEVPP